MQATLRRRADSVLPLGRFYPSARCSGIRWGDDERPGSEV